MSEYEIEARIVIGARMSVSMTHLHGEVMLVAVNGVTGTWLRENGKTFNETAHRVSFFVRQGYWSIHPEDEVI